MTEPPIERMEPAVDLSSLDPARDAVAWEARVQAVLRRVRRRPTIAQQVVSWRRPLVTLAAAAAVLSWLGAVAVPPEDAGEVTAAIDAPARLAAWAERGGEPTTAELLSLWGGAL